LVCVEWKTRRRNGQLVALDIVTAKSSLTVLFTLSSISGICIGLAPSVFIEIPTFILPVYPLIRF